MTPVVLVVEAQPALRDAYAQSLRGEGYRVLSVAPCARARRLLREAKPQLLILDPECGGGWGRALALEALRADPSVALIYNTSAPQRLATDFSSWMADAYTVRSSEPGRLAGAARALLGQRVGPRGPSRSPAPSRA
ncbi:MAG: hypothetical protein FJY75_10835 [Candidatus Eisenbacteria bacterium]|uniref:Response regulatory domain-containing protein n=1 Tax=Eiseniibacteriota bacterium TaxID=2212470 RepID=A0A938BPH3_UNCEI|nr:hypothetical protein [Candidatus Eisenbacteria bacterium]